MLKITLKVLLSISLAVAYYSATYLVIFGLIKGDGKEGSLAAIIMLIFLALPLLLFTLCFVRLFFFKTLIGERKRAETIAEWIVLVLTIIFLSIVVNFFTQPYRTKRDLKNSPNYICTEDKSGLSCKRKTPL